MADKNAKKAEETAKPKRVPADQLLANFLRVNNIILIVQESQVLVPVVENLVYAVDKRPAIKLSYKDELPKAEPKTDEKMEPKPQLEVSN